MWTTSWRRIDLQLEAYGKEADIPPQLFQVLNEQREGLLVAESGPRSGGRPGATYRLAAAKSRPA